MSLEVHILGAGREIGRSCVVVGYQPRGSDHVEARIMFDCGIHLGHKEDSLRYPDFRKYLNLSPSASNLEVGERLSQHLDCVVISHFHLDHMGAVPYLTEKLKFSKPVYASPATKGLAILLLSDFMRNSDGGETSTADFSCSVAEAISAVDKLATVTPGVTVELVPTTRIEPGGVRSQRAHTLRLKASLAGHILGAVLIEAEYAGMTVVYTGDFNTSPDSLLGRAQFQAVSRPDLLISEGTYAIMSKDSRRTIEREMCRVIYSTLRAGGKVLLPCFATGKAQDIASCLLEFMREALVKYPVLIGGQLTEKSNVRYRLFSEYSNATPMSYKISKLRTISSFEPDQDIDWRGSAFPALQRVTSEIESLDSYPSFLKDKTPGVLFAAPAMLNTGLSLAALKEWAGDPKNLIVMTGSCTPGSVGNKLVNGAKTLILPGARQPLTVACKVRYCAFANHAGHFGLRRMVEQVDPYALMFVHGDAEGVLTMSHIVSQAYGIPTWAPENLETVRIDVWHNRQIKMGATVPASLSPPFQTSRPLTDDHCCFVNPHKGDGVYIAANLPGVGYVQEAVSQAFFNAYLMPKIKTRELLTSLWEGAETWLRESTVKRPLGIPEDCVFQDIEDSDDEEGELEDGEMTEDDEEGMAEQLEKQPIKFWVKPGDGAHTNFSDSKHFQALLTLLDKGDSVARREDAKTPFETFLEANVTTKRSVVRLCGWLWLDKFRDLMKALEMRKGGDFAYLESGGHGVLVWSSLGLSMVVTTEAQKRSRFIQAFNKELIDTNCSRVSQYELINHEGPQFLTPAVLQLGLVELRLLMRMAKSSIAETLLPLAFWRELGKLFLSKKALEELQRVEPVMIPAAPPWLDVPPKPQPPFVPNNRVFLEFH
eukprot:Blabericola_migrator_1__9054@NODE_481_length_8138_cov_55_758146_g374_i0_p1_GENE_NODE_481_length_8138_cov_55_758146_g374_i0NODE_481_length_8138_cov_55_758146_g374_i0_p1_ORF_typecomplete_len880_score150_52Lactamase_B_6/PF16661_5/2_9e35BetaCasp/PF10996_8/4_3e17Lactamase_B_2/PF12706_7/9_1e15Lactamase_B_2/PF12706_7/1_5e03Lactamase_B/PF00753_27/6_1e14RMMBL/PF07521_12/1_2e05Lactamase_B_3/PF13483_6/3_2e05Lactamase_B_3/PF13483_6/1_2e04PDEase_II/PF02112_15/0_00029PDEase_II/PF02112_15/7_2e03_NODE_481_lengt